MPASVAISIVMNKCGSDANFSKLVQTASSVYLKLTPLPNHYDADGVGRWNERRWIKARFIEKYTWEAL